MPQAARKGSPTRCQDPVPDREPGLQLAADPWRNFVDRSKKLRHFCFGVGYRVGLFPGPAARAKLRVIPANHSSTLCVMASSHHITKEAVTLPYVCGPLDRNCTSFM